MAYLSIALGFVLPLGFSIVYQMTGCTLLQSRLKGSKLSILMWLCGYYNELFQHGTIIKTDDIGSVTECAGSSLIQCCIQPWT